MNAKPRSQGRKDWPSGMKVHVKNDVAYYSWVDPRNGKEKSLQCKDDVRTAIKRSKTLNAAVAEQLKDLAVESILNSNHSQLMTIAKFSPVYLEHCNNRGMASNTLRAKKTHQKHIVSAFGDKQLDKVSVHDVNNLINKFIDDGKARTAVSLRSDLTTMYKRAKSMGLVPRGFQDPASITEKPKVTVERSRLTLDKFKAINEMSKQDLKKPWIANSQLLALLTGQRLQDVHTFQFKRGADWEKMFKAWKRDLNDIKVPTSDKSPMPYCYVENDHIYIMQRKTGAMFSINIDLGIDALGLTIRDVIRRCKSKTVSRFMLHHTRNANSVNRGDQVSYYAPSKWFKNMRNKCDLKWDTNVPASFHEIRSLSARLYKAEGYDAQAILGHTTAKMTEKYTDPRHSEWTTIRGKYGENKGKNI